MLNTEYTHYRELVDKLNYCAKEYYENDTSIISDSDYDLLYRELEEIEAARGQADKDSPTQRVGNGSAANMKVQHAIPMLSMRDVFNFDELKAFIDKVHTVDATATFVVEPKYDGLACSLVYQQGTFVQASTRGDGHIGEDVTRNASLFHVPIGVDTNRDIELRGEVIILRETFKYLNQNSTKQYSTLRNTAAGLMRQHNTVTGIDLVFKPYDVIGDRGSSYYDTIRKYTEVMFKPTADYDEICRHINEIAALRQQMKYDIDGAVIKVNDFKLRDALGNGAKYPNWQVAYKFQPTEAITRIKDVVWQVGRTGVLTPVATVTPVALNGVMVTRCTLHNLEEIAQHHIAIGSVVKLVRSGDVIPKIVETIDSSGRLIRAPKFCPVCGALVDFRNLRALRCTNNDCIGQRKAKLSHFVSRSAMNIVGIGENLIDKLIDNNVVTKVTDFYRLDAATLEPYAGIANTKKIMKAIEASKHTELARVLYAIGIPGVGSSTASDLAQKYGTIDELSVAPLDELKQAFGDITGSNIWEFLQGDGYTQLTELLGYLKVADADAVKPLLGKKFCITGTLQQYTRSKLADILTKLGAKVTSSVSKDTTVIVGQQAGSKLRKAEAVGAQQMNETQLQELLRIHTK